MKKIRKAILQGLWSLWLLSFSALSFASIDDNKNFISDDSGAYHYYKSVDDTIFLAALQPLYIHIPVGGITTTVPVPRKELDTIIWLQDKQAYALPAVSFMYLLGSEQMPAGYEETFKTFSDSEKKAAIHSKWNIVFEDKETHYTILVGDFNGDGLNQFLVIPPTSASKDNQQAFITTNGSEDTASIGINLSADSGTISVRDVNDDGRDDIVVSRDDGKEYTLYADEKGQFPVPDVIPEPDKEIDNGDSSLPLTPGASQGEFRVSESGSATYRMPVPLPRGIAGLTPQLALNYDSGNSNGHLGMGWSLSGLSAITRCRKTLEQDGKTSAKGDRFCLDGQRLIAVKGSYGANGTEYRTEIDSQTKVVSYGSKGGYPQRFTVWRKDGSVSQYGATGDAFINAQGKDYAMAWAINKTRDSLLNDRNAITFSYTRYPDKGEYTIKQVAYAGGQATVNFVYDNKRTDKATFYSEGSRSSLNQRLNRVEVRQNNQLFRQFYLRYQENGVTGQSRLTGVQACSASHCYPQTTFEWGEMGQGFTTTDTVSLEKGYKHGKRADINGDGREDYSAYLESGHSVSYVSDGTKLVQKGRSTYLKKGLKPEDWFVFDYNGDGRGDILYKDRTWKIRLSNGQDYGGQLIDTTLSASNATLADVDGDGLPDLVYTSVGSAGSGAQPEPGQYIIQKRSIAVRYLRPNKNTRSPYPYLFSEPEAIVHSFDVPEELVGNCGDGLQRISSGFSRDITGNGQSDFILQISKGTERRGGGRDGHFWCDRTSSWYLYTKKSSQNNHYPTGKSLSSDKSFLFTDLNGDTLPDWLRDDKYYLNTGNGFDKGHSLGFNIFHDADIAKSLNFIDYNGDGKQDLFYVKNKKTWVKRWNGNGFDAPVETSARYYGRDNIQFLDLNGDGRQSYVYFENNGKTHIHTPTSGGSGKNRIMAIDNGAGNRTEIDYKPLTDSRVYTKGTGGAFKRWGKGAPVFDLMAPSYVVSQVSSTAPTAGSEPGRVNTQAKSRVSYHYANARVQGGGRGMLGFGKLTTTDEQTGVITTTTYRQDFPYSGSPVSTEVKTAHGQPLSFSQNSWSAKNRGRYWQLMLTRSVEKGFDLDSGALLQTVTTHTTYDSYSNPLTISIQTKGGGSEQTKATTNTYTNNASKWHLGRLTRAVVTTTQGSHSHTRTSSFGYNSTTGMLISETVEPGNANELTTTYSHDSWGNTVRSRITGKGIAPRESRTQYSNNGWYADRAINALGQTTSSVLQRNAFGQPLKVQDSNGLLTTFVYDSMGREIRQRHGSGSGKDTAYYTCSSAPIACAAGGKLVVESRLLGGAKSWMIQDGLGREIRRISQGFDGTLLGRETEYDNLSRPVRVSEPFAENNTVYWNETEYDILGRITKVTQAGGNFE